MSTDRARQRADELLAKAREAAAIFSQLSQEHTDRIVKAVYEAAFKNRVKLARMAERETGIGRWEDKVIKNAVASLLVYEDIKDTKTAGVISDNKQTGIMVGATSNFGEFSMFTKTSQTNLWQPQVLGLDSTLFYTLLIAIVIILVVFTAILTWRLKLYRKK